MNRRPGVTLLEVLVAIFVMGIGMLALLTLFPIGALSMAQAIRDDRCAQAAVNANAIATVANLRNDSNVTTAFGTTPAGFTTPDPLGSGYPVYVDPVYANLGQTTLGQYTGPPATPGLSRVTVGISVTAPTTVDGRWFTLLDDMTFKPNATPDGTAPGPNSTPVTLQRPGNYTWAYLLRRLQSSKPGTTEMYIVVYSGRSVQVAGGETVFTTAATGNQGDASVTLSYTAGSPPPVRRGSWILDVSYETVSVTNPTNPGTPSTYGTVHGQFYRVVDVNAASAANQTQLEIDPPLRNNNVNTFVVMENVVEVFYKGTGWRP